MLGIIEAASMVVNLRVACEVMVTANTVVVIIAVVIISALGDSLHELCCDSGDELLHFW